jgi:hypothetical protein
VAAGGKLYLFPADFSRLSHGAQGRSIRINANTGGPRVAAKAPDLAAVFEDVDLYLQEKRRSSRKCRQMNPKRPHLRKLRMLAPASGPMAWWEAVFTGQRRIAQD